MRLISTWREVLQGCLLDFMKIWILEECLIRFFCVMRVENVEGNDGRGEECSFLDTSFKQSY